MIHFKSIIFELCSRSSLGLEDRVLLLSSDVGDLESGGKAQESESNCRSPCKCNYLQLVVSSTLKHCLRLKSLQAGHAHYLCLDCDSEQIWCPESCFTCEHDSEAQIGLSNPPGPRKKYRNKGNLEEATEE